MQPWETLSQTLNQATRTFLTAETCGDDQHSLLL